MKYLLFAFIFALKINAMQAQYPQYFSYNDENGAPSNEIYSLIQDAQGFIWLGTAAGLYKFDGLRYIAYKCSSQKSRAIAGLTLSSNGQLYGQNFQSQIFYVQNDSLHELKQPYKRVPNIACDQSGRLWVNHLDGISAYDEVNEKWQNYKNGLRKGDTIKNPLLNFTRAVKVGAQNQPYFIADNGIGKIEGDSLSIDSSSNIAAKVFDLLSLECYENQLWFFPRTGSQIYTQNKNSDRLTALENEPLQAALNGRKITQVRFLSDNNFWICTYSGLISYSPKDKKIRIFYPDMAFSDALLDREGNYWFSTLQQGFIRVPNLSFLVWQRAAGINSKVVKIQNDGQYIYFANFNSNIGRLKPSNNEIKNFNLGQAADIQALDYVAADSSLYFYVAGTLYALRGEKIEKVQTELPPIKQLTKAKNDYFVASSFGVYIHDVKTEIKQNQRLSSWTREMAFCSAQNMVWAASNNGLFGFSYVNDNWILTDSLFLGLQITNLSVDKESGNLYIINFIGEIYSVDKNKKTQLIAILPKQVQAYKLKYYAQRLYIATNKGLWLWDLSGAAWQTINTYAGLAANNVQDISFISGKIWLAVGQGLQQIPLEKLSPPPLAKLYLNAIQIANDKQKAGQPLFLHYQQPLILQPQASIYSSNGNFEYAYRVKSPSEEWSANWSIVPAATEKITILNIPAGAFELELKAIDHLGRASENIILLTGYVSPPFWRSYWFSALILIVLFLAVFYGFKKRELAQQQRQAKAIAHLELENALRQSEQIALKAQMNPHFIFNVLNSIKGYIYKNDKQNASAYLNAFSDLIRSVLDRSGQQYTNLAEELQMLELYISLEAMLLQKDFSYNIKIDEDLAAHSYTLPAMLLQPYIENAFKHGLQHRSGEKKLAINVFLTAEAQLCIEIEDNGIGRRAAQVINDDNNYNQSHKHQSFATQATTKRIELINREAKQYISSKISDLYAESGEGIGTKVTIVIDFL
jgi:ligand-binding sensor domain-containing protein